MKELYAEDSDFSNVFAACEKGLLRNSIEWMGIFRENKLCIPSCSMCKLLVQEAQGGGLMGHFGIKKTLATLQEHFFWPRMRRDVERICARCIQCKQAKSRVLPHGLYTPLPIPNEPWVDISVDFIGAT